MSPIIVENSKIPALLSVIIEINAITLWPFIFFRGDAEKEVIQHESIHIAQYNELFVIGFLFLYCYDYIKGLIKYKYKNEAYYSIRFEQEAYLHESTPDYLSTRQKFEWKKFDV